MWREVRAQEEKPPARAWCMLAVTYLASIYAPIVQFKIPPLMLARLIEGIGLMGVEGTFRESLPYLKSRYIWFLGIVLAALVKPFKGDVIPKDQMM